VKYSERRSTVVAARLPKFVIDRIDVLAARERRTRSNFLAWQLGLLVEDRALVHILETVIDSIVRDEERDEFGAEFQRGQLHAAKRVITALLGESRKDDILEAIRETGRRIPHSIGRLPDGSRVGWDSDAG